MKLSATYALRQIPEAAWRAIDWERFQDLVGAYLTERFSGRGVRVTAMGPGPDGGRDFELAEDGFRQWRAFAECKKYGQPIGTAVLGKYVVVAVVNGIDELFIFSASPVTSSARADLIHVFQRLNIRLTIYDGGVLDRELSGYPRLIEAFFPAVELRSVPAPDPLGADVCVSRALEAGDADAPGQTAFTLYDTACFVHVLLKNNSEDVMSNVRVELCDPERQTVVAPHPSNRQEQMTLHPMQDRAAVFTLRAIGSAPVVYGIVATVTYSHNGSIQKAAVTLPIIELSTRHQPPIVGEGTLHYLQNRLPDVVNAIQQGQPRLIDVRGVAGVGKSRLLNETAARLSERGLMPLQYDAMRERDGVLRRLLADLADLPLYKGRLEIATSAWRKLLLRRGCAPEFAESIVRFLSADSSDLVDTYDVRETLKHFISRPVVAPNVAVLIDNVQELSPAALRVLLAAVDILRNANAPVCLLLSTNTEIMPLPHLQPVAEFLNRLDGLGSEAFRQSLTITPLDGRDAKLLLLSLLEGIPPAHARVERLDEDDVLATLIAQAGTRPLDLVLAVHLLEERRVVRRVGSTVWYVDEFETFSREIGDVPRGSDAILERRLTILQSAEKRDDFLRLLRYLLAFRGQLPVTFIESHVGTEVWKELARQAWVRVTTQAGRELVVPFHDAVLRHLESNPAITVTSSEAVHVLGWLESADALARDDFALVELLSVIRARRPASEVLDVGERAMTKSRSRGPADVRVAGERVISSLDVTRLPQCDVHRFLRLKLNYADALLHQAAIRDALKEFDDLYFSLRADATVPASMRDRFYHAYINAHLHTARYRRAVEILDERERIPTDDLEYRFLLFDRYAVAYTALGDVAGAEKMLDRAISLARDAGQAEWESIAFYDMAYVHVHVTFDHKLAAEAFQSSIAIHDRMQRCAAWRVIESEQARALVSLMIGDVPRAIDLVRNALWRSARETTVMYDVKLLNLLGTCYVLSGRYDEAAATFEIGRSKAAMSFNERAFWRAVANLGALAAVRGDLESAALQFEQVERHVRDRAVAERAFAREVPILANYIAVLTECGETSLVSGLLQQWTEPRLAKYAASLRSHQARAWRQVVGLIRHDGFAFLAT